MYLNIFIYLVILSNVWSEAFFHLSEKPIFLCFKVCPLYCPQRRSDEDAASLIYVEDDPYSFGPDVWVDDYPVHTPHHGHFVFCKPKTTTTTPKPTTTTMAPTTEEPTWICMVCKQKCPNPKS